MKNNLLLGVVLALLSSFLYSSQTALVKAQAAVLPPLPVVIFIQCLISLLLMLPLMSRGGMAQIKATVSSRKIHIHALRTVLSLGLTYLLFYSVKFIPLVNGLLLMNTAPLIMPFAAYFFFSQRINHRLWVPLIIGFIGIVLVLNPDPRYFNWASLLALASGFCLALGMLLVRRVSAYDSSATTNFYFLLLATLMSGLGAIKFWVPLTGAMALPLLLIGVIYFLMQNMLTQALRFANAQVVSTMLYSSIIFAVVISKFVWHTFPASMTWYGIIMIVMGGVLCIHQEHRTQRKSLAQSELQYAAQN